MIENKKIYFIRHGKLLLNYKSHAEMPMYVLADLASRKIDPPVDNLFLKKNINKLLKIIPIDELDIIYVSPSRRCKETAKFIGDYIEKNNNKKVSIIISSEIKEVEFDLYRIYGEKKEFNYETLNDDVFEAMISGVGGDPVKIVQSSVNKFMDKIEKNKNKKILVISHDFIMRVMEIYIKISNTKKEITFTDLKNTQRNDYLNGFSMYKRLGKLMPIIF